MGRSIQQILAPKTILKAVSQFELPGTALQNLFGWGFGGSNRDRQSGRHFSYDIFDTSRKIATGRVPGQAANRQAPRSIGTIAGTFPRAAETISLLDEDLLNRRRIGGPSDELDQSGESYITRQEAYLAQRFANLIEFQTAAMIRGSYTYDTDGEEMVHGYSGGDITIDFQIPEGHKDQLDILGNGDILDADWAAAGTDIPAHLHGINAAMVEQTGMGLAHIVLTGTGWQQVINNTQVKAMGGSSNVVFESMRRVGPGEFSAILRAMPWITFHIVDYGLETWNGTSETFTKLIEDDHAAFLPEISPQWAQYLEGSEVVTEGPGGGRAEQFGFHAWSYPTHDPSGWNLNAVANGIPALYNPKASAYGQISGGLYE